MDLLFFLVAFVIGNAFVSQAGIIPTTQPPPIESGQVQLPADNPTCEAKAPLNNDKRHKRFDYEDMHESEDDDDWSNEVCHEEESSEPNFFMKIAKNWRVTTTRLVCLAALLTLITIAYYFTIRIACRYWCKCMQENCALCFNPGIKRLFQQYYTDPTNEIKRISTSATISTHLGKMKPI